VTFSIVARDPANGDLGVAVASKFLAVGSVVPWARAGVGAIATQALANVTYGPDGLAAMAGGNDATTVLATLIEADDGRSERQLGMVDARGGAATHTGTGCLVWAGGRVADGVAVQGNILAGPEVVDAMLSAFEAARGPLPDRLLAALLPRTGRVEMPAGANRRPCSSSGRAVVTAGRPIAGSTCGSTTTSTRSPSCIACSTSGACCPSAPIPATSWRSTRPLPRSCARG
jgi:uncharacterized Ntn-hydrolase superfamily protein